MWTRMTRFWPSASVNSLQEGLRRVRNRKYALIVDAPLAEYLIARSPCDLYAIEPFLEKQQYAFVVAKQSSLKHGLNQQIHNMLQNADMQDMYLKWWINECKNLPESNPCVAPIMNSTSLNNHGRNQGNGRNQGHGRNHGNGRTHGANKVGRRNKNRSREKAARQDERTIHVISSAETSTQRSPWRFVTARYIANYSPLIICNNIIAILTVCLPYTIRYLVT